MPSKETLTRAQRKYDSTKRKENRITIRISKTAYATLKQFALLKNMTLLEVIDYLSKTLEDTHNTELQQEDWKIADIDKVTQMGYNNFMVNKKAPFGASANAIYK